MPSVKNTPAKRSITAPNGIATQTAASGAMIAASYQGSRKESIRPTATYAPKPKKAI